VQITDCHLGAAPGTCLLDVDTDASLGAVLDLVRAQRRACDLLLATGDLSDHGSAAAYRRLREATRDFGPARWLPGNHDSATTLRATLAGDGCIERTFRGAHWQIVTLDSAVPGEVGGQLALHELEALRALLETSSLHTLLAIHHPVLPVGCAWLDRQRVANADALWALLANFPQVRAVLCGHVHQPFDAVHRNVRVLCTPSTAWQFAPHSADYRVDAQPPGYRWLRLHADGRIDTGVERVAADLFRADVDSTGY
jgi:Icc protein